MDETQRSVRPVGYAPAGRVRLMRRIFTQTDETGHSVFAGQEDVLQQLFTKYSTVGGMEERWEDVQIEAEETVHIGRHKLAERTDDER